MFGWSVGDQPGRRRADRAQSFMVSGRLWRTAPINEETHVFGPDLLLVDTDWPSVRKDTDTWAKAYYEDFFTRLENGDKGADGLKRLADLVDEKDRV